MSNLLPFLFVIGAVIAGKFISESALKRLSSEEKARLVDGFSLLRKLNLIVLLLVLVLAYLLEIDMLWAAAIYLIGLAGYIYRKLSGLDLPNAYTRLCLLSMLITYGGVAGFFVLVFVVTSSGV